MVECKINLDSVFNSLADATRRDILKRVTKQPLSISQLAEPYKISFAAVAKHVGVLASAHLVKKQRKGKEQIIQASPKTIHIATTHLKTYEKIWEERFNALDDYLSQSQ